MGVWDLLLISLYLFVRARKQTTTSLTATPEPGRHSDPTEAFVWALHKFLASSIPFELDRVKSFVAGMASEDEKAVILFHATRLQSLITNLQVSWRPSVDKVINHFQLLQMTFH